MRIAESKCRIVLIGLMAAGKSTVGRSIASRTGWVYLDNDLLVTEAAGSDRMALLTRRGEEALRSFERLALDQILEASAPLVASVAGGVLLDPSAEAALCRSRNADAFVVWLRAPHAVIADRIAADDVVRPWISDTDPVESIVHLASAREPVYERCADLVVDAYGVEAEDAAAEILAAAASSRVR